jgi:hypothetical protein
MSSLVETVEGYRMMFSSQAIAASIAYYQDWYHLLPRTRCPVMLVRAKGGDAVTDEDFSKMKALIPDCAAMAQSEGRKLTSRRSRPADPWSGSS